MSAIFLRNMVIAFFDILYFLILVRLILSFFPVNPYSNPTVYNIIQFFRQLTEPFLAPFRNLVPPLRVGGGAYLDLSPVIAIFVLSLLKRLLLYII